MMDPTGKCVIVLNDELSLGLAVNAASVVAVTLGRRVDGIVGPDVPDASGSTHVGITTIPVPVLKACGARLAELRRMALDGELLVVDFTDAAQETRTYTDYTALISTRPTEALCYLALGFFGDKKRINSLTGSLPLLR